MRRMVSMLTLFSLPLSSLTIVAQTPAKTPAPESLANLNQLMRGAIYPPANVVFASQNDNPADAKIGPGKDPSLATDPLVSTFGGWQAVENASLALWESSNLLMIARTCSNGLPAPTKDPEWAKFVQQLRDGAAKAYKAAQTKNQDNMIEASDAVNAACANCHRKWREKRPPDRCK